jgi:nucleotide-binding universal stress UspA family protein
MKPERILVPIDVTQCPLEVFDLVNGFAGRPGVTIILLNVVNLNVIAPESRVFEELCLDARRYLERLAEERLHPMASILIHVRVGKPADQILAEAKEESADLIILPTSGPSFWRRLATLWRAASNPMVSLSTEKVIREAACGVFMVLAKTRMNCERVWGRQAGRSLAGSGIAAKSILSRQRSLEPSRLQPREAECADRIEVASSQTCARIGSRI